MDRDQAQKQLELLKRIAVALEKGNTTKEEWKPDTAKGVLDVVKKITDDYASKHPVDKLQDKYDYDNKINHQDIPGFEGTLDTLDNLTSEFSNKELHEGKLHTDDGYQDDDFVHNDYLIDLITEMNKEQYIEFCQAMSYVNYDLKVVKHACYELEYEECLGAIKIARNNTENKFTYEHHEPGNEYSDLVEYHCGVINDSDWNIRKTADSYQAALDCETHFTSKKECIMDYITNEFGMLGARYTDIIKFAYYLGSPNAPKYTNANRGYYSMGFAMRYGGHLITGGKDQLVKGINNEGDEKYFALSFVDSATEYWKRLDYTR